jgi:hypothetical protein
MNAPGRFGPFLCPVCRGGECRGGGVRACFQRDPKPSIIVGIVDTYGGVRFVVTHRNELKHHLRHDEVAIIPAVRVHEPIAWGDIPSMIGRIEHEVTKWLEGPMPNEPHKLEAWKMHKLRRLEQPGRSLNLYDIVET